MSLVFFLHLLLPVLAIAEMSWSGGLWVINSEDEVSYTKTEAQLDKKGPGQTTTHIAKAKAMSEVRSSNHTCTAELRVHLS